METLSKDFVIRDKDWQRCGRVEGLAVGVPVLRGKRRDQKTWERNKTKSGKCVESDKKRGVGGRGASPQGQEHRPVVLNPKS